MELEVHPHQTPRTVTSPPWGPGNTNTCSERPKTYDPGVVESENSNNVNTLFLDSLQILNVGREMLGRTAGCESPWTLLT